MSERDKLRFEIKRQDLVSSEHCVETGNDYEVVLLEDVIDLIIADRAGRKE